MDACAALDRFLIQHALEVLVDVFEFHEEPGERSHHGLHGKEDGEQRLARTLGTALGTAPNCHSQVLDPGLDPQVLDPGLAFHKFYAELFPHFSSMPKIFQK